MEIPSPTKKFIKEINAGSTSLVMLCVLDQAEDPLYGYQIAKMFEGEPETGMKQSALYPVLRSLEKNGLLESRVEPSVTGPPRKYYNITAEGRNTLIEWTHIWQSMSKRVDTLLEGGQND